MFDIIRRRIGGGNSGSREEQSASRLRRETFPRVCLGDVEDFPRFGATGFDSAVPADFVLRHVLRKWWEWRYLAKCAEELDLLNRQSRAIGFGVGSEPLIFYFAQYCNHVLATDMYSADTVWTEARHATLADLHDSSPIEFPKDRLEIKNADMRSIPVPDGSYDFAWSCSSIEHVPTLIDLVDVFAELSRVLRIGGYALLTTEFCLTPPPYLLPGVNALDADLFARLVQSQEVFEVVGPIDFSYNWHHPGNAARPRRYLPPGLVGMQPVSTLIPFKTGQMANLVGLSMICPIGIVLRRRRGTPLRWQDMKLPPALRDYCEGVRRILRKDVVGMVDLFKPHVEAGPTNLGLQYYTLFFRYYIEAMAIEASFSKEKMRAEIDKFLSWMPSGELQDADCLDMIAYQLQVCEDMEEAARLFRLAAESPSTTDVHAVKLAFDHLFSMIELNRFSEGADLVVQIVLDLLINNRELSDDVRRALSEGIEVKCQDAELQADLKKRLDAAVLEARSNWDVILHQPFR